MNKTPTKFQNDRTKTVRSCAHKIPPSLRLRTELNLLVSFGIKTIEEISLP